MNEIQSFKRGIKPAIFDQTIKRSLKNFPYLIMDHQDLIQGYVFFRTPKERDQQLAAWKRITTISEQHQWLGQILGFPPKAVEHYIDPNPYKQDVGIHYCGITFGSNVKDVEENINWLWEKHQQNDVTKIFKKWRGLSIHIGYGDMQKLKNIQKKMGDIFPILNHASRKSTLKTALNEIDISAKNEQKKSFAFWNKLLGRERGSR
ncbi:hypothetical protein SAMN05444392_10679 [Seinonella peptonophila]|uniref:Uncharacterized protein n=1 Tax=Seinonella peptonophila TaxID=112248 RepID=A0A1M4Y6R7_9BACL|nr:hypothetical protein [Seinonella peptonophila]SHF01461.1 hypothetical protein SAMN05444392_10679 [Seinonella peptonophila]